MKERPVVVGGNPDLVAIVSDPDANTSSRPCACLLLNAGLVHRVGPNRLHVRLARALAGRGFRSMRLDLSGRGDSDVRRDGMSFIDSSVVEIRSAMDYLEKSGSREFVLMGICSGAVNALQLAAADSRVVGCVPIDAPAFPTAGYYVRYYVRRLFRRETWANTLTGRNALGRLLRSRTRAAARADDGEDEFANPFGDAPLPPKTEVAEALQRILTRGVGMLFIYTGSWSSYNYRAQLEDAFPFMRAPAVRVEYFANADHTFTGLYNQQRLIDTICEWISARYSLSSAPPQSAGARRR